jgi:hypothetical protein
MILNAIAEKLKRQSEDNFKSSQFEAWLILQAVAWYLRYPLSYRDIEKMFGERGFKVDHSTINRWVTRFRMARVAAQGGTLLKPDNHEDTAACDHISRMLARISNKWTSLVGRVLGHGAAAFQRPAPRSRRNQPEGTGIDTAGT